MVAKDPGKGKYTAPPDNSLIYDPLIGGYRPRFPSNPSPPTTAAPPKGPTDPDPDPKGGGGGGYDPYAAYAAAQESSRQRNAIATIKAALDQYGLSSLYDVITGYVKEGYDASTVMTLIRTTPQYKQRFPAMEALAKQGRAISEATYIDYERGAAGLEQRYGLPKGMLTGNVTKLLERDVSTVELNDRVALSASASLQAPQDLKDTLSRYYGIGQGSLTAYFLDPEVAMPLLQRQYATAQIGTEAIRQDVGLDVGIATQLEGLGVTQDQARAGFGEVSRQREFVSGAGDTVDQNTLIMGNVAGSRSAAQEIERVGSSRTGRFQGGGGYISGQQGGKSGLQGSSV